MDTKRLTRVYLKMRDEKDRLTREYEEQKRALETNMEKISAQLLKFLNDNAIDSSSADGVTFFKQEEVKPSCSDWSAFHAWIAREDAFDMLQKRITVTALKEYMETNEGALPPGVNVHREYVVRIRRK